MKILQIHPLMKSEAITPKAGGMAKAALTLTRLLLQDGHNVQVLPIPERIGSRLVWGIAPGMTVTVPPVMDFPAGKDLPWLMIAGPRLRPLPRGPRALAYDAMALVGLRRVLRSFQPDIVHNHLARAPFPRLAKALQLRPPMVLTHHHGEPGETMDAYDRIVFPSEESRKRILLQSGCSGQKARCVYNAVDPAFLRGEIPPDGERSGIFYVGAVRLRKGIDLLLEAYRSQTALQAEPLHICGTGENDPLVKQMAAEGRFSIHYEGRVSAEEIAGFLRHAKLVVIPSRLETLSVALVEAICVGTPVVGWAPTVLELERGFGLPVGVPFDGRTESSLVLADRIREALEGEYCRTEQRIQMAAWARNTFSETKFLQGYLKIYQELL